MSGDEQIKTRHAPRPCPICSKMSVERYHPFCSVRCANVDLNRWLKGGYAFPTDDVPAEGELARDDGEPDA